MALRCNNGWRYKKEGCSRIDAACAVLVQMGAAFTWITGFFLLYLVYAYSYLELANPAAGTGASHGLLFSFLLAPFIYDMLAKSALGKNPKAFAAIGFILICAVSLYGAFGI